MSVPDDRRLRPLQPGLQISVAGFLGIEQGAGTIACFVQPVVKWITTQRPDDVQIRNLGAPCLMTCYHVLKPPPSIATPIDHRVHQPNAAALEDVIGEFYVGAWKDTVDAALCRLSDRALDNGPPQNNVLGDIGRLNGISEPTANGAVRKYGRTTRLTTGTTPGPGVGVNSDPLHTSCTLETQGVKVTITNCFTINGSGSSYENFGDHGDSGAGIVDEHNNLVGILCHGGQNPSPIWGYGIACRATDVFAALTTAVANQEAKNYPVTAYPSRSFELHLL
jgi:hypothetical protein